MNNLSRILGPAPSELSHEELLSKLTTERNRVREAFTRFREAPMRKASKAAKKKTTRTLIKNSGFSVEELLAMIEEEKNAKGS